MSSDLTWDDKGLPRDERWRALARRGATLWFTGLSGSGKSTIAGALERALVATGVAAYRIDGDNVRHGLNADLGFSDGDRSENVRRIGEVALLFADSGSVAIVSAISPFREDRDRCRARHVATGLTFLEVFVDAPYDVCAARDPKGLYARAQHGDVQQFTGIASVYEPPLQADLTLATAREEVTACVQRCLTLLGERQVLP